MTDNEPTGGILDGRDDELNDWANDTPTTTAYKAGAAAVISELRAHFDQYPEIISRTDLFEALDEINKILEPFRDEIDERRG